MPNKVPGATAAAGRGPHFEQQGLLLIHLFVNSTKKKSPGDSQEQARPVDMNSSTLFTKTGYISASNCFNFQIIENFCDSDWFKWTVKKPALGPPGLVRHPPTM